MKPNLETKTKPRGKHLAENPSQTQLL